MPRISVLMPTYNRAHFLKYSIPSILNQTYGDFEFIIINDASTDNTRKVINSFIKKDKRIKYFENTEHKDLARTLNWGVNISKGEYIARMDDDDVSHKSRFKKQVEYLDCYKAISVVGSFICMMDNKKGVSWIRSSDPDELDIAINFVNPMSHPSTMIRSSFLQKNSLNYRQDNSYAEDYYLWKDIILKGGRLANIPEILLNFRINNPKISNTKETSRIQLNSLHTIRFEMLGRFFNSSECEDIDENIVNYPFHFKDKDKAIKFLEILAEKTGLYEGVKKYINNYIY